MNVSVSLISKWGWQVNPTQNTIGHNLSNRRTNRAKSQSIDTIGSGRRLPSFIPGRENIKLDAGSY